MRNILIADDEEPVRITLLEWFATAYAGEFNILMAENGSEAVRALKEEPVSVLVTDLNMPRMDGFELIAYMKNNHPSVPVVVMSAFATPEIRKKVEDLGAVTFLPKPLNFDDLSAIDFRKLAEASRGHVNGISLQSFMQLIDMEGKTCTLFIESEGRSGTFYIRKGELYDARTGNISGEEAAFEIMTWSEDEDLTIEIENDCPEIERKIEFTIMHLLMESARLIDERKSQAAAAKPEPQPEPEPEPEPAPRPEPAAAPVPEPAAPEPEPAAAAPPPPQAASAASLAQVHGKLKDFSTLDGFGGIALISHSGETMCKVSGKGGFDVEQAAVLVNNVMVQARKAGPGMGGGDSIFLHLETTKGHALVSCLEPDGNHPDLRLILFLENDDAMGLAKMMLRSTLKEIMVILMTPS